ncbi:MAG: hypothetical protein H0T82_12245 [Sphingomonas sp.]|nr:hypothetical protein [Sphingomonas sp.]
MKVGGPWDSTFEPMFNQPDNEISAFVEWLSTLGTPHLDPGEPMVERIAPQSVSPESLQQMARVAASLLARSPAIRHSIKLTTEHFRGEFGLKEPADKPLIAANQRGLYDAYRTRMESSGRWAVLFSDQTEFITGDGFFHNFPASQDAINSGRKLVLPLLPTAALIYMLPTQHPTEPRLVTLHLGAKEVRSLNEIAQVYASDFLFFRDQQPRLTEDFRCGAHKQFQYHRHTWLDPLLDDLSQYNRWGARGSASIGGRRSFSEYLRGDRWLEEITLGHR